VGLMSMSGASAGSISCIMAVCNVDICAGVLTKSTIKDFI
jgi:hypothetical protein